MNLVGYKQRYIGFAADEKPTDGVRNESIFQELDTGITYLFYSGAWYPFGTSINDGSGKTIGVQYPLPTDGDSVYCKDIDESASDGGNFSGGVCSLFNDYTSDSSEIFDSTSNNPKTISIVFNRPILTSNIGIGSMSGNFSNVKILLKDYAGTVRQTIDDSANNTKYTSNIYAIAPSVFIQAEVQFHTADTVTLNGMFIPKNVQGVVRLRALKPDGTETDIDATTGGNLKVSLEELENQISVNGNSQLRTTLYDSTGRLVEDGLSEALQFIDHAHHEIHSGDHYMFTGQVTLGAGGSKDFLIITPNTAKQPHLVGDVRATGEANFCLYEDATVSGNGTPVTVFNRNRNSLNVNTTLLYDTPTVDTLGTCIYEEHIGAGQTTGGDSRGESEIILKSNTIYLFRINSESASNDINFIADWYEFTDPNA